MIIIYSIIPVYPLITIFLYKGNVLFITGKQIEGKLNYKYRILI